MNKKKLGVLVATALITASLGIPVHAADGDIYDTSTNPATNHGSIGNIILKDKTDLFKMITSMGNYGYEVSNNIYKLSDVNSDFNSNPGETQAQIQSDVKTKYTPVEAVPVSTTLTGAFNNLLGQTYVTVTLPSGVFVSSVTVNGVVIPNTNYSVNGTTLTIVGVTSSDTINVTGSNGTVYAVTNGSNSNNTTGSAITISNIPNITMTVQNMLYTLPSTVTAIMSDGSTKQVAVTWKASTSNPDTYNGTVNGYSGTVVLTLTTPPVRAVAPPNLTTTVGTVPTLPSTVSVILCDGTTTNAAITWSAATTTASTYANTGTVTVTGTLPAYDNVTVTATVIVNPNSNIVTFKDSNLEQAVRQAISKPTGDIYKSDVDKITQLVAENKGIQDISGIENLTNLQTLDLGNTPYGGALRQNYNPIINQISDVSALQGLTNLTYLDLSGNQISDISALSRVTKLQYLSLYGNQISNINALSELTKLQYIDLSSNKINDISVLKELLQNALVTANLKYLNLIGNQISDHDMQYLKNTLPNCHINEPIAY